MSRQRSAFSQQGRRSVGHPVDVASGVFFTAWHDAEIAGAVPITFRRYFATNLLQEARAGFGSGWTHNFALGLSEESDGYVFRDRNGGHVAFQHSATGIESSIVDRGANLELRHEQAYICIYHWHDWRTAIEKYWFARLPSGRFRLERITPPSGLGLLLDYDRYDRLVAITQMIEGRRLSLEYSDRGLVSELRVGFRAHRGRTVAEYRYDATNRLEAVLDATATPILYRYDTAGRIVMEQTRGGAIFQMRYDSQGRCVSTRGSDGHRARRLMYALSGLLTVVTDSLGNATAFALNSRGQVLSETRPNGAVLSTRYDDDGRIVQETDPLGRTTYYSYDERGNTSVVQHPSALNIRVEYDQDHQPTSIQAGESIWRLHYADGLLYSTVDPAGVQRRYSYDTRGFLRSIVEPSGNVVRIEPDPDWSQVRVVDDYGLDRVEQFDDVMNRTAVREPDGSTYRFVYDSVGRLLLVSVPGSPPRRFAYDHRGFLESAIDEGGHETRLRFSPYGLLEEATTPAGRTYTFEWDSEDHLKTWTLPSGHRAAFEHDAVGNEVEVRYFDGRVERSVFNLCDLRTTLHRPDGTAVEFQYDRSDCIARISANGTDLIVADHDAFGRLLRAVTPTTSVGFAYDLAGRMTEERQNGHTVRYSYDLTGALRERQWSGSRLPPLEFDWDRRVRVTAIRRGTSQIQAMTYDAKDQLIERHFGACIETLAFGPARRWVSQTITRAGTTVIARRYRHDGRRDVVASEDYRSGEALYEFDGDRRLVRAQSPDGVTEYSYDRDGSLDAIEGGELARRFERSPGGAVVRSGASRYERDANGNVIAIVRPDGVTRLKWDPLGQLVGVTCPDGAFISYAYDGLGRRLRREGRDSTEFVWSGNVLLAEVSAHNTTEYLFGEFVPTAVWRDRELSYVVADHRGVPAEEVDEWGFVRWSQTIEAWGSMTHSEGQGNGGNPFRFAGQYRDNETGFHYNRFRYYDPIACEYLSPDPVGVESGFNVYAYCPNPINWIDPFGLSCGIKAGTQSVYVLQKGPPPAPPTILYVGITMQSPHDRLSQHRGNPPGGLTKGDITSMRIIATGSPTVPDRVSARLIEASILNNGPQKGQPGAYANAERPVNTGTYYHSNIPSAAPAGTTYLPPATTSGLLSPTNGTTIK